MHKSLIVPVSLAIFLTACTPGLPQSGLSTPVLMTAEVSTVVAESPGLTPAAGPSPTPVPKTSIPTLPASSLSPTELKYKVLDRFPDFFFCDPDLFPVARDNEMELAQARFLELQANWEEFQAILDRNGLSGTISFTDNQKLLIYREHKKLHAIRFELSNDRYRFQIQIGSEGQSGSFIEGTIDGNGSIEIQQQNSAIPTCPICLAAGTLIDTPRGAVSVEELRVGDPVWTVNAAGEHVFGIVVRTSRAPVPADHPIIRLILSDGRELWASPGHPTVDGRVLADLEVNDLLDGAQVVFVERLTYNGIATYDILPSGDTGFYWANGILVGSTLGEHP